MYMCVWDYNPIKLIDQSMISLKAIDLKCSKRIKQFSVQFTTKW